ncbi:hypothetical protein [Natrinema sp. DC36]|uniref:hypothetical protein n=1 Tax=Natrinema sp. DC36 TaxID=2878680 RepID=UPI001CEFDDAA|nr:hypothetical protein [Natrinema sp. DC36]
MTFDEESWEYDAFRVGRATRSVDVASPEGPRTIEEGTIRFDLINEEDHWLYEEDSWIDHFVAPGAENDALEHMAHQPMDKLGIVELPEPMTTEDAHEWLDANPEQWRQFLDESIESDTTAEDLLGEIR